ncbi:MAG: hypothetical protein ACE5FN_11190 [Leptospirillia bacterium]
MEPPADTATPAGGTAATAHRRGRTAPPVALFGLGMLVFGALAFLGWQKLSYGFSFIDEGMYMTDAWRLTVGDRMFPDNATNVVRLYVLFNMAVFKLWPDVTLLGFRQLQFGITLITLAALGAAMYRWTRTYWYLPLGLCLFAFTGLDPVGKGTNLSYHNYTHLFIAWHLIFLVLALPSSGRLKNSLLAASGVALWGMGMSVLPMAAGAAGPVLLWLVLRRLDDSRTWFTARDLAWVLGPVALLWLVVLGVFRLPFFHAMGDMLRYFGEGEKTALNLNIDALSHCALAILPLGAALGAFRLRWRAAGIALALLAGGLTFWMMTTSVGGRLPLYWRGWFAAPMWFSALLIVFMGGFAGLTLWRLARPTPLSGEGRLLTVLLLPSALFALLFGSVSEMGYLSACYVAIPATAALALALVSGWRRAGAGLPVQALALTVLLLPFVHQVAWADWRFTYFDMPPERLTHTIPDGFAGGIRTNPTFARIAAWMTDRGHRLSGPDDFVIAMNQVPMVHMLTGRRPALNHSWLGLAHSLSLQREALEQMRRSGRAPRLAFRFVRVPMFFPTDLKAGTFAVGNPVVFSNIQPVAAYIARHMRPRERLDIKGQPWVELWTAKPVPETP